MKDHGNSAPSEVKQTANRLSAVSVGGNAGLAAFKLFAGLWGNSAAMVADAAHSFSDLITTFIAWIGVHAAQKPADAGHPYGHERFESAAALLLSAVLAAAGIGIAWEPLQELATGSFAKLATPEPVALAAAAASIVVKEWMFRYTKRHAERIGSPAFLADAWHHRSDALSSVGSLAGIAGSMAGLAFADSLAGVIISIFVLKAAWDVGQQALSQMLDASCGAAYEQRLADHVAQIPGVEGIDVLRTRRAGSRAFVELEIGVAAERTFAEAHDISELVHASVEETFSEVKHAAVHVSPVTPA